MFALKSFYPILALLLMIIMSLGEVAYGQKLQLSEIDSLRILLRKSADGNKKVLLLNEIARRYLHIRSYDSATTITTRAKMMAERSGNTLGLLKSHENFVMMYREQGDIDKALKHLKTMLELSIKMKFPLSEAEAYDQLGHIYHTKNDSKRALLNHQMALDIRRKENDAHGIANSADNIAQIHYHLDDYLKALDYWDEAYHAYKQTDNYWGMARTSANLGLIHYEFSNFSKSIALFYEARTLYNSIQNNEGIIWTSNLIGHVYMEINKIDNAKDIYSKSLEAYVRDGNQKGIALAYTNLSNVARKKGEYDSAKRYCEQAIKIYSKEDSSGLSFFHPYRLLAEMDYELGDRKAALTKFLAMVNRPMVTQNVSNRITIGNWIGRIYNDLEKYNLAGEWLHRAIKLNARTADKSAFLTSYKTLAKVDSARGDFRSALLHTQKYYMYRDSLEKQKAEKIVLKYEYESQIAKALETSKERQLQRNIAWTLAGLAFLFALGSWRYLSVRSKHRLAIEKVKKKAAMANQAMKSRFLTNISHEFRTPLTLINGHIELLMAGNGSAIEKSRYVEISKNGAHLLGLVDQLLELSKMDDGHYKLHYEKGQIVELIGMEVANFESEAIRRDVELKIEISKSVGESLSKQFVYSRQAVTAIVYNLLSNALKYTPKNGAIEVQVDFENESIHLSVSNTGSYIAKEHISKVFDRFYQLPESASYQGFGIGLSLVKELATYHGGRVGVESQAGGNTTFHVWLEQGCISADTKETALPISIVKEQDDLKKTVVTEDHPLILLVDDHDEIRQFVKESLGDSYQFMEATDGTKGLEIARAIIPDLIISDIMMPQMNGIDFCQAIKHSEATSHIPVLLLTAIKDQSKKEQGLSIGADDYIYKPFSVQELRLRIRNRLASQERLRTYFASSLIQDSNKEIPLQCEERNISKQDKDFIRKLINAIHLNLDNKQMNVEFLANVACLSASQLTRKLKALINKTPAEFVRIIKMNYAKQMLESGARVADTAWATGYDDPANFAKVFKKQFGYSPSQQQAKGLDIDMFKY